MAKRRLRIADFEIEIVNFSDQPVQFEKGYLDFLSENNDAPDSDVLVEVFGSIPDELRQIKDVVYSAEFNGNTLWKIAKTDSGLRFHVYNANGPFQLQQVADLASDFSEWKIYTEPNTWEDKTGVFPLMYPMGPLVMYYLTAKYDAVMIHGSGITHNEKGRIFTGVSGKGKTTMAKIWFEHGAKVLNDDRLIIRNTNDRYTVHNTPMFYSDKPRKAELNSLYIIRHFPQNELRKVIGSEAVSKLAANLIQHGYDQRLTSHHLNFLSEMVEKTPVFSLGFVPNQTVIETIMQNESR